MTMNKTAKYDLTYLALGGGYNSSAMLVCSNLGLHHVPKADVAIFADTGDEPQAVYNYIKQLQQWSRIPIHVVSSGCISRDTLNVIDNKRSFTPLFTMGDDLRPGMLMRKCTTEFKLNPIEKEVRKLLGYEKGVRAQKCAQALIGIGFDEIIRMKPSRTKWITNCWPLVDAKITRARCRDIIRQYTDLPDPTRSACWHCPYHSDLEWKNLKNNHPVDFAKAVKFDEDVRNIASRNGISHQVFLHRSCVALKNVDFSDSEQLDLWGGECEGMCGV